MHAMNGYYITIESIIIYISYHIIAVILYRRVLLLIEFFEKSISTSVPATFLLTWRWHYPTKWFWMCVSHPFHQFMSLPKTILINIMIPSELLQRPRILLIRNKKEGTTCVILRVFYKQQQQLTTVKMKSLMNFDAQSICHKQTSSAKMETTHVVTHACKYHCITVCNVTVYKVVQFILCVRAREQICIYDHRVI